MPSGGSVSTDVGTSLLRLGLITCMLVGGFAALGLLLRWFTGQLRLDRLARRRARHDPPPASRPRRPLEVVAADVRRLGREVAVVPSGVPMARRRGLLAAYDDVLVEAAELLEVPHHLTGGAPDTRELERMRLLASLEAAGLVVEG